MPPIRSPRLYYPKTAVMFHRYAQVVVGNPLLIAHDVAQNFSHYAYQSAAANGDTFTHPFYLEGGTYTLAVLGWTANNGGRVDWYIDGVKVVSLQDWYSGGNVYNVVMTAAVTVYGHGQHTLKGVENGKNGLSSSWRLKLTAISLV